MEHDNHIAFPETSLSEDSSKVEMQSFIPAMDEATTRRFRRRRKKHKPKTELILKFDADRLLDMHRLLFEHGLTFHQFFGYITQQLVERDPRLMVLVEEARQYKKQRVLEGKEQSVDAETLYSLIQEHLGELAKENGA